MHADDELTFSFLRHAEIKCISDLGDDAIAKKPRLMLYASEIFAPSRRLETEDILHYEDAWLEELHETQVIEKKQAAGVVDQPARTVIRAITLARGGEPLAGRPSGNDIDLLYADQVRELRRAKLRKIAFQNVRHIWKVRTEGCDSFGVEVESRETFKSRPFHSERKAATAAEQIYEGWRRGHALLVAFGRGRLNRFLDPNVRDAASSRCAGHDVGLFQGDGERFEGIWPS